MPAAPFTDAEFPWGVIDPEATKRAPELYPASKQFAGGSLVMDATEVSWDDIAQGTHPDCFFISAVTALIRTDPKLVARLFRTPTVSPEGKYELQFFRDNAWRSVTIDDRVPVSDSQGTILFARSPKKLWWPLLLEKGYAAFYSGFGALAGGNVAECLHDLTGMPVRAITIANPSNPKAEKISVAEWKRLSMGLRQRQYAMCAGTIKSFQGLKGGGYGLQSGHAYCVARIVPEHSFVVLVNPVKVGREYCGPLCQGDSKMTATMKAASGIDERRKDWFAIPLAVFTEHFASLIVCAIREDGQSSSLREGPTSAIAGEWAADPTGRLVGGCTSFASFTENPAFVLTNPTAAPVTVDLVLKQPCQRFAAEGQRAISYRPAAINVFRRLQNTAGGTFQPGKVEKVGKGSLAPFAAASPFFTGSTYAELVPAPRYLNQRDVSLTIQAPPGELVVVPATFYPVLPTDAGAPHPFALLMYTDDGAGVKLAKQTDVWNRTDIVRSATAKVPVKGKLCLPLSITPAETVQGSKAALSLMLEQKQSVKVAADTDLKPDNVAPNFTSLALVDRRSNEAIDSTVTINYARMSLVVPLTDTVAEAMVASSLLVVASNGKGKAAAALSLSACVSGTHPTTHEITVAFGEPVEDAPPVAPRSMVEPKPEPPAAAGPARGGRGGARGGAAGGRGAPAPNSARRAAGGGAAAVRAARQPAAPPVAARGRGSGTRAVQRGGQATRSVADMYAGLE